MELFGLWMGKIAVRGGSRTDIVVSEGVEADRLLDVELWNVAWSSWKSCTRKVGISGKT